MSVCRRRVSRGCAARLAVRVIRANPGKSAALASELRADGEEANRAVGGARRQRHCPRPAVHQRRHGDDAVAHAVVQRAARAHFADERGRVVDELRGEERTGDSYMYM